MALSNLKKFTLGFILIATAIVIYAFFWPQKKVEYITEQSTYTDIQQIIEVNGTVESNSKIDLRFQKSGKIEKINFSVGEPVFEGNVIAQLENENSQIEIEKALANVNIAKADLNLRYAGPSNEEIKVSKARIEEAEINLRNAEQTYDDILLANSEKLRQANLSIDTSKINLDTAEKNKKNTSETSSTTNQIAEKQLQDNYDNSISTITTSIDSIQNALNAADQILGVDQKDADNLFENEFGGRDQLVKILAVQSYNNAKLSKEVLETRFNEFQTKTFETQEEKNIEIENLIYLTQSSLTDTRTVLDKTYYAIEQTPTINAVTPTLIESLKLKITPYQENINLRLKEINLLIQTIQNLKLEITKTTLGSSSSIDSALLAFEKAKNDYEIALSNLETVKVQNEIDKNNAKRQIDLMNVMLKQANANHENLIADPRYVDIAGLQAKIDGYDAALRQAERQIKDSQIMAPINSIVTDINADLGENISAIDVIVVLMSDKLQVKANVSESDITKLQVGNEVYLTFDSLSLSEIFTGKVININPAETVVDGVIYYETLVSLDDDNEKIRSGMTSDLQIYTDKRENVLAINSIAVEYDGGKTFVYVFENEQKIRKEIKLGLSGENYIEVLEGLSEGDEIIIYEN